MLLKVHFLRVVVNQKVRLILGFTGFAVFVDSAASIVGYFQSLLIGSLS